MDIDKVQLPPEIYQFLDRITVLVDVADDLVRELNDSGLGYMAERLERALQGIHDS
jgi:hypothetical protein